MLTSTRLNFYFIFRCLKLKPVNVFLLFLLGHGLCCLNPIVGLFQFVEYIIRFLNKTFNFISSCTQFFVSLKKIVISVRKKKLTAVETAFLLLIANSVKSNNLTQLRWSNQYKYAKTFPLFGSYVPLPHQFINCKPWKAFVGYRKNFISFSIKCSQIAGFGRKLLLLVSRVNGKNFE